MTRYFEVTDRDCAARIGRLMPDQRSIMVSSSPVKRGITERHGHTGRGTVYVLKGSNDSETTQ